MDIGTEEFEYVIEPIEEPKWMKEPAEGPILEPVLA